MPSILEEPSVDRVSSYMVTCLNGTGSSNPATSTSYEFGSGLALGSVPNLPIPVAGRITRVLVLATVAGTLGTSEATSVFVRLNSSSDNLVTNALTLTATSQVVDSNALNIAVSVGDVFDIKYTTPSSWATPPTGIRLLAYVFITPS